MARGAADFGGHCCAVQDQLKNVQMPSLTMDIPKGPCAQIVYTVALKESLIWVLGYMDP